MLAFPRVGRCPASARRRRKEREPPLWQTGVEAGVRARQGRSSWPEEPTLPPGCYGIDFPKSARLRGGKILDVVHYFLVDEGTNLAAVALSVAWCGASLKLFFFMEGEATPG